MTKAQAPTLEELAAKLEGVDAQAFLRTVREFNAACRSDIAFNPNVLDGRRTAGLAIEKTNWANPLDTPPFHAYHVTTGVTFTFGGHARGRSKTFMAAPFRVSMRPVKSSAGCSITTMPAAPA